MIEAAGSKYIPHKYTIFALCAIGHMRFSYLIDIVAEYTIYVWRRTAKSSFTNGLSDIW